MVSPVKPVHLLSLTPRIYAACILMTCIVLKMSNIVRTFHVPITKRVFASRRLTLPTQASILLALTHVDYTCIKYVLTGLGC